MKIVELEIGGFRSLRHVTWQPGDLNVIIGPNGSGKSNLLRALDLIVAAADGRLAKTIQSAGGMDPLVWDGAVDQIAFRLKTTPPDPRRDPGRDSLTYQVALGRLGKSSQYRIDFEQLANYHRVETGEMPGPFKFLERSGTIAKVFDANQRELVAPNEAVPDDETLLSLAVAPFGYNPLVPTYRKQVGRWTIHHDMDVSSNSPIRQAAVSRIERTLSADGRNLTNVLHTLYSEDREFKAAVNAALRAAFGLDFEELLFPPAADQRVQLRLRWKSLQRETSAADLSDGTLRFLALLAILASPDPGPVVAIDEPEAGLHPSMLPIIAEYASEASQRSQLIFTTHSPQFLNAFRETAPTVTVASCDEGATSLTTRNGDELADWLRHYSLGSLFEAGDLEALA